MKKVFFNIIGYSIFVIIAAFVMGFFAKTDITVCSIDYFSYRLNNGLIFVLKVLPSAIVSSFLIALAIDFKRVEYFGGGRFSSTLIKEFKNIFIVAIVFTFLITMITEVFYPFSENRKNQFEKKPSMIQAYLNASQKNLLESLKNPELANLSIFYSKKILELDSKNKEAKDLLKRSEELLAKNSKTKISIKQNKSKLKEKLKQENINFVDLSKTKVPDNLSNFSKIEESTVLELIEKAEELFSEEDYLASHYYAQFAVKMADQKDVNLQRAKEISNRAWNVLSKVQEEKLTEENLFFREKFKGYKNLTSGDFLSAYYVFQRLNNHSYEYSNDPDVKRFLEESRKKLETEYFFIDETKDKNSFESANDVYFSIKKTDGSYDIYLIKGITDVENTGEYVRYLRDFYIFSFSETGSFEKSMYVPYAKMLAVQTDVFDDQAFVKYGIDKKWKTVPFVMLCSVDRDTEGVKISPTYRYEKAGKEDKENKIFIPLPYDDFTMLSKVSDVNNHVNYWGMNKLSKDPSYYGYSNEVVKQKTMISIFYPFMILIIFILAASIGWNYRMTDNGLFKFSWIFIYPAIHFVVYGVIVFAEFFIKLLNFILIGIAGTNFAVYVGILFYLICLILVSILFLSRKGD